MRSRASFNGFVMRLIGISLLSALSACAVNAPTSTQRQPTRESACWIDSAAGWLALPQPPEIRALLMETTSRGKTIADELGEKPHTMAGVWFRSPNGAYRYCRYSPGIDACNAPPGTEGYVDFVPNGDRWTAEGPLYTVCLGDSRGE